MPPDTDQIARPDRLAHLVLRSPRYEEAIRWWTTVLGAHVVHRSDHLAFLTYDDEHHRLAIVRQDLLGDDGRSHAGLEHIAFGFDSIDKLVHHYRRLRDLGITPILPINHGMTLSLYYADPDGVQAEFQVDLLSPEESARFMESATFDDNPLGVVFDPEQLVAQHAADEPLDALAAYGPDA